MYRLIFTLSRMLLGLAALFCLLALPTYAQTPGPNGFYYPVASLNPTATFLETGCDGYISQHYHLGWDLLQPHGSPVYAVTGGTIENITNTGDPDVTFIWISHSAVDPSNGNTFTFWAVYGHTSIKPGLVRKSVVHGGDIIGYTVVYTPSVDHCHFGINRNGIITTVSYPTISYINGNGQNASSQIQAGWGRGTLPSDWCGHESQNKPLLQANSGATENFTDPQAFLNTYRALGSVNSTDIYVDLNFTGTQNGSSSNPYNTVTAAVNAASTTQAVTIHVKTGSYHEKVTTSKKIHFVVWNGGTVQIGG